MSADNFPTETEASKSEAEVPTETKTEGLRRRIEGGAYHVPAEEIAAKIIKESSK